MSEVSTVVVGNLTDTPELRYTQGGHAVANFTIASTPRHFDKTTNEWKDGETVFLRASVWRQFAEQVAGSLTKGDRVVATGTLKQRSYQDREGNTRSSIELEVDDLGASLKHATATVTRVRGNERGYATAQAAPVQDDTWATPGSYGDDTPF